MVVPASWTTKIAGSGRVEEAAAGTPAASAAAASRLTIHHPPEVDGAGRPVVNDDEEGNSALSKSPRFPSHWRIRPPSPIPLNDGHNLINECLAESVKT